MNKRILHTLKSVAFGGCLTFMVVSCRSSDRQIAQTVSAAASTVAPHVTVLVQNGVVTLHGILPDTATQSALDTTIKGLKGVVSVIDHTSFGPQQSTEPPPPPPPSNKPYDMIYPDTLVERTMDTGFTYNHISGVNAKVSGGIVTLTGKTAKKDLKTILLIANESHPKNVINRIVVK